MLKRRLYYALKPHIPWRARVAIRRIAARKQREASAAVWPIDPSTATPPPGWKGWPDGRKFSVVLTHDVEGPEGLAKCKRLADLEAALGFRSCFNLVPEGTYAVPAELRQWLRDRGFEVGVHDLHHDGGLYASREAFRKNARSTNRYLKEWGACGFRSGFMLHELDWIHDLDIAYDCSTFDTDPFEPQPDAAGTIFPFWIPAPGDSTGERGYVELPYTLAQDSTLFLILGEKSPEIWLQKLEWIIQRGGMALVNVHPDYLRFPDEPPHRKTFPVGHYVRLLEHIKDSHAGEFWHPLPGQLAAWFDENRRSAARLRNPAASSRRKTAARPDPAIAALRGKCAAVLLYAPYPFDTRAHRAAEAMIEAGMEVDMLCLSEGKGDPPREVVGGVNVFRRPLVHSRGGPVRYLWNYGRFIAASVAFLFRRRYDVIHVHNMPDFLVFAALFQKFRGARILLDLHDPMPELMMSIYGLEAGNWKVGLLKRLERRSIGFSDVVFTPNIAFRNIFVSRSCPPEKVQIVMNTPEETIFVPARFPRDRSRRPDKAEFRIMHHGSILHRHGIDLLVEAMAKVRPRIPGIQLDIYGPREPFLDTVLDAARSMGISDIVHYHGAKSQTAIAEAIQRADLGVIPNRGSVFTRLNFPTRIFEYLAMGCPVIAPATRGIQDYFGADELPMFEQGNVDDLAGKILWVWSNPDRADALVKRGREVYRKHLWQDEKARLLGRVAAA